MFCPALAAALTFGSLDIIAKGRSVQEIFNQEIRDNLESYNEFIEEYEDRRYIPAEMIEGVTEKIVMMYQQMPEPAQNVYAEIKSKIAGPHSIQLCCATGEFHISTKGLDVLHKFFPTKEEIEAHEAFGGGGGESDDDW